MWSSSSYLHAAEGDFTAAVDPSRVTATIKRIADWQLDHPVEFGTLHWAVAPLLDGLIDASLTTGESRYLAAVIRAGTREAGSSAPTPTTPTTLPPDMPGRASI